MPIVQEIKDYGFEKGRPLIASVIVATYEPRKDALQACLNGLKKQSVDNFEVVLVENGSNHFSEELVGSLKLRYIKLDENYGPTIARNIGAYYADCELLIFLEDDGVPTPDFVEAHVRSYDDPAIVGVRGKYLPATDKHNPYTAGCYDLGEKTIPALLNVEGNCSVKKSNFIDAGGWSTPVIYAHEGLALTYELTQGGKLYDRTIYNPKAVIFHDNNKTLARSLYLSFVMGRNIVKLERVYPDLKTFAWSYESKIPSRRGKKGLIQRLAWRNLVRAALFRLHDESLCMGKRYEKISRLVNKDTEPSIVDLNFFNNWSSTQRRS